ncbi:MAG: hypothetical protein ACYCYE_09420 [Clostridia bacterium]
MNNMSYKSICDKQSNERRIKALVVIAEKNVQKIGDLIIIAPIGVGIDQLTGDLSVPVRIEAIGKPCLKPKIINDVLINEGFVRAKLIVEDIDPEPCPDIRKGIQKEILIPVQSVIEIKGIRPGDHIQEFTEIKSLSVFGIPERPPHGSVGTQVKLIIKVILDVKIIIAREEIITVSIKY